MATLPLGSALPFRRSLSSSTNKTGIARNIGKPASLFNDLFLYNLQSLEGMGFKFAAHEFPERVMAVYTDVAAEELGQFLAGYDIGELLSSRGIAGGVETSNLLVHPSPGSRILTLYERPGGGEDPPFFLGLMEHLAARGITCPQPVKNRNGDMLGTVAGRPAAIITFLEGMWIRRPSANHCAALGTALARLHRSEERRVGKEWRERWWAYR